ncbi:17.6 kDa class I heat shock protein 3 [Striga hermonthica]|uniref:17.6 kDa class I heat shock protein 3 n=1 Tax=Striga hermonthica TaxID=68872 RepID=A0A9N7MNS0_STRHE|nr:17.6 kDa class I heat shock protein 3 [Striga hermonthica]
MRVDSKEGTGNTQIDKGRPAKKKKLTTPRKVDFLEHFIFFSPHLQPTTSLINGSSKNFAKSPNPNPSQEPRSTHRIKSLDLSPEITMEILLCLPLKSLLRFRICILEGCRIKQLELIIGREMNVMLMNSAPTMPLNLVSTEQIQKLDLWDPFEGFSLSTARDASTVANARIDWKETPEAHVFKVDVPGLKREEVKVKVEVEDGSILQISGERSKEENEKNDKLHRVERISGKFLHRFKQSENAKLAEVKAAMENGVLTVTVPKEEVKKPEVKAIDISG